MITIRKAILEDAEGIIEHCKIVFAETDFLLTELEEYEMTIEKEQKWILNNSYPKHLLLVAENEAGEIIGMLNFSPKERIKVRHIGYFGISIQEKYCNGGLGAALIEELLTWAKVEPGIEKVCLEVFSHNERAYYLYKKLGFIEEGRKIKHIKTKEGNYHDEIMMYQFVK
ncbi:GNAT family N-acetyltransferase [Cytobacillus gottheilii]|uniref:GNAT family N-acetyltransferase n=1 Tax=Cytobacillus gottheilii TaxID=859144 RepID=UPI001119CBE9|nr:GNAT family protein [Cytobacillus gottheilii]